MWLEAGREEVLEGELEVLEVVTEAAVDTEEVQEEEEEEEEGTTALDPVQRLFLEKIREYNNMQRLKGGPLEAEKRLSEETEKLQRLYGGGDLRSFPQFTFTEPDLDQSSK
ncbi:ATP synthase-coupling factor 6, mitochondrial isoform X2 [Brachyistius frenatus]|uniref:ATP synthase-coupling factor 6, mitochondrial isoform X2 n=1 Tax=Brachyistius frenatus TaxID=100188 RepID=UPI0037E79AE4